MTNTFLPSKRTPRLTALGIAILLCSLVLAPDFDAQGQPPSRPFNRLHQAGIRIGAWTNSGDSPPKYDSNGSSTVTTDFKGGAFYFEAYFGYRFSPYFVGELSFGLFNRGDVNLRDDVLLDQFYGNLLVYPLIARAKLYPLGKSKSNLQPYLTAGGGFYYAHHNIQFYQSNVIFTGFNTKSATSFEYTLGGGFDLPIASKIALELNGAWMPLKFSKNIISIRNYDGLAITLGVKYLFSNIR